MHGSEGMARMVFSAPEVEIGPHQTGSAGTKIYSHFGSQGHEIQAFNLLEIKKMYK